MEIPLNVLMNNSKIKIYINSNDTVYDIIKLVMTTYQPNKENIPSNYQLFYIDKQKNKIHYMLSPYRTINSYENLYNIKELFIEEATIQLDSFIAICLENFICIFTLYYFYKNSQDYIIQKIVFYLSCVYFICRLFINLKFYNNGKYLLTKLIFNLIICWFLYSIICGYIIFSDEIEEINMFGYLSCFVIILCIFISLVCAKEIANMNINNILFKYVKYPYLTMDCCIWIAMYVIVKRKRMMFFVVVKILYDIYLAFEKYIEEQGSVNISTNMDYFDNVGENIGKTKKKLIIPFIL